MNCLILFVMDYLYSAVLFLILVIIFSSMDSSNYLYLIYFILNIKLNFITKLTPLFMDLFFKYMM